MKKISHLSIHIPYTIVLSFFFLCAIEIAHAQTGAGPGAGCPPDELCNPLKSATITEFLLKIIDVILIFALPIIIFFIMYAGFLFVTARGNESQVTTAKNALLWAVIGGVIVLGARVILSVIQGTITAF